MSGCIDLLAGNLVMDIKDGLDAQKQNGCRTLEMIATPAASMLDVCISITRQSLTNYALGALSRWQ